MKNNPGFDEEITKLIGEKNVKIILLNLYLMLALAQLKLTLYQWLKMAKRRKNI